MRNLLYTFLILGVSLGFSQKKDVCPDLTNELSQTINQLDFQKANSLVLETKTSCQKYSQKIYALAIEVLQHNLDTSTPENKEQNVQEFLDYLNLLDKNFPDNTLGSHQKRALLLYQSENRNDETILASLEKAYSLQRDDFTDSQLLFDYLQLYYNQSKKENTRINTSDLIARFNQVIALADTNTEKKPELAIEYDNVKSNAKHLMASTLTCENWNNFAATQFQNNQDSISWIANTATSMHETCKTNTMLENLSLRWLQLEGNSRAAYFLGDYYLHKNDSKKAISYFEQSIALAKTKKEKAENAYVIAMITNLNNPKVAYEMVNLSIENDENNPKYYLFLAELYTNAVSKCASNDQQKAALNQLALQTIKRAMQKNPESKKMLQNRADTYYKNLNSFKVNKKKTVTLDCFINQKVTF